MPTISLVVCLRNQAPLLRRLLEHSIGCYDELVVVHDGQDESGVEQIAREFNGRFFARELLQQQEAHWPFAWAKAGHNWILRLDADEIPSIEMKEWLVAFRSAPAPPTSAAGYGCHWPVWRGDHAVSRRWPTGRLFLFDKCRVAFIGMPESEPVTETDRELLDFTLRHEPPGRETHTLRDVLFRAQAYRWREAIVRALRGPINALPSWRWTSSEWPKRWKGIREAPLRYAIKGFFTRTFRTLRDQWRADRRIYVIPALIGQVNDLLICWEYFRQGRGGVRRAGEANVQSVQCSQ